jgi:hypothetical protein
MIDRVALMVVKFCRRVQCGFASLRLNNGTTLLRHVPHGLIVWICSTVSGAGLDTNRCSVVADDRADRGRTRVTVATYGWANMWVTIGGTAERTAPGRI